MIFDNKSLSVRMKALAEEIGNLPSTGTIKAELALEVLGESVQILLEVARQSGEHVELANRLIGNCEKLYASNCALKQQNTGLAWNAIGAMGIEGRA